MIDQFEYYVPTHVLFGAGSLKKLHDQQLPGKKALVVTTNGGNNDANPLPLSDEDILGMFERSYR